MDEEKITEQKTENPLNPQNEYNYNLAQQITKRLRTHQIPPRLNNSIHQ